LGPGKNLSAQPVESLLSPRNSMSGAFVPLVNHRAN
jgi:hypothetical protein